MKVRVAFVLAVLVFAFLASELVLPGIAERRVRDELREYGNVDSVTVSAVPALKLLLRRADRIEIRMSEARADVRRVADLLEDARAADEVDARVASVDLNGVTLRDLRMRKDGDRLHAEAGITDGDLAAALPESVGLRPVDTGDGRLVLEATAGIFGSRLALRARLSARDGALVIAPDGLLGGFATLRLFSDPRVDVTGVGARPRADGFTISAEARLANA